MITYIYPSRSRPTKFFQGLDNIIDNSYSDNFEIICSLDEDDETMNNDDVRAELDTYDKVKYFYGKSSSKINACNREASKASEKTSILCLFSDDMRFIAFGFDDEIREAFKDNFPALDGVVHFPDSHALARTMTMTMMGINMYKKLGYLYHPSFLSVYADNHLTEMAKSLGKYKFINKNILDHFHPIWNMTAWDAQYRKTEHQDVYKQDKDTYEKLKANNYGL